MISYATSLDMIPSATGLDMNPLQIERFQFYKS
jgi:hypothetical protein